jgi:hypothetical protein
MEITTIHESLDEERRDELILFRGQELNGLSCQLAQ